MLEVERRPRPARWGAVVLSGGSGSRLGGADKSAIELGGRTLLERALAAVGGAGETLVVGPGAPTSRPVRFTREDPAGSGPAAALQHGAALLAPGCDPGFDIIVALAVDMPFVDRHTVARLLDALGREPGADAAVLHDGRRQPLCAAYRTEALLQHRHPPGSSMRALLAPLRVVEVAALGAEASDVDHWSDLESTPCAPSSPPSPEGRRPSS